MSCSTGALARAAGRPLVAASVPVTADCDALALWQSAPDQHRFYLEQPATGVALAGIGATATLAARGPARFRDLADALSELTDGQPLPPGVVAVGGYAFDDVPGETTPWRGFPAAEWIIPRVMLVRRGGRSRLVATTRHPHAGELPAALARAQASLARPLVTSAPPVTFHATGAPSLRWRRAVEATLADIAAGRLTKLVLARACGLATSVPFDPLRVAARLRRAYPGCTIFAVGRGAATFVGASPERLVRLCGGRLDTGAVAGTAARGSTAVTDRALARGLMASPKERGEHAIVVDDILGRLAPLCDGIAAAAGPRVVTTETLQHLRTPIHARLRPGRGLLDAVAALHPTASICGAPRGIARAMLAARERIARGWYAGGVGWLDASGGEIVVAIRTALLRGATALLHAGAGIVAGSAWDAELEETRLKMRPLLAALLEL
jgi:salicylate biosynthesis isochorismate synthase